MNPERKKYPIRSIAPVDGWVKLECAECGEPFWAIPSKAETLKTCGLQCRFISVEVRLERSLDKQDGGCWIWNKSLNIDGYGQMKIAGEMKRSHRVSWEIHRGPIPGGMDVLHKCIASRACCNPDHLYLGTSKENQRDCIEQGRRPIRHGELCPTSKLTEQQVLEIRSLYKVIPNKEIAERFKISPGGVCNIVKRRTWSHI